jgi:hypothetical protein
MMSSVTVNRHCVRQLPPSESRGEAVDIHLLEDTMQDLPDLALVGSTWSDMARRVSAFVEGESEQERGRAADFLFAAFGLAVEMWYQKGDPAEPAWTEWMHPWRKLAGDNPGTVYLSAPVSARHRYRLRGPLAGAHYVGVQLYHQVQGFNAPSANISSAELVAGQDGRFELVLGGERPTGAANWLPLEPEDYVAMVRVYSYEPWTRWDVSIERIDDSPAEPLSAEARLAKAASYFEAEVRSSMELTELIQAGGTNAYGPPDATYRQPEYGDALFPTLDNTYEGFFVDLQADEAILLHGRLPKAKYTSLVFYDRWWATPDYPRLRCYLTDRDLVLNTDGTYDAVIAASDPGVPNWIDTGGLAQGVFASRFLLAEEKLLPEASVVKLAELPALLASA